MSPPCFVSPFIKKLLENFLLGSWSFFHFIFYIFPHTSFVSLSIAIFSYFLRQIIARDCRRKLPSCPFHLKTMDSLPLSQNKKPFPLLIRWNSSENIRRTSPNQVVFSMKIYYFLQKCSHFRSQTFLSHPQVSTIMWLAIQLPNQFGTITTIFVGDNFGFTFRYNLSNLCLCLATPSEMKGWTCWSSFQLKKGKVKIGPLLIMMMMMMMMMMMTMIMVMTLMMGMMTN